MWRLAFGYAQLGFRLMALQLLQQAISAVVVAKYYQCGGGCGHVVALCYRRLGHYMSKLWPRADFTPSRVGEFMPSFTFIFV